MLLVVLSGLAHASTFVHTIAVDGRAVHESTSQVKIVRNGDTLNVAPGDRLVTDDLLTTGHNAQVVLISEAGAVEIFVQEDSTVQISSIFVKLGEIYVRVKEALREKFEVESEYGVAGVEGTEFVVRVTGGAGRDATYSCVTLEGTVVVRSAKSRWPEVKVFAGMQLALQAGSLPDTRELDDDEIGVIANRFATIHEIYRKESVDVRVPSVVGLTKSEANKILREQRLLAGDVETVFVEYSAGYVTEQVPRAGESVAPYSLVSLIVEIQPTTVPNLIGLSLEEAEQRLAGARLRTGSVTSNSTEDSPGTTVIGQTPEANTTVPVESRVDLVIGTAGPARPQPPVIGQILHEVGGT